MYLLQEAIIYLVAALIAVPISKRFGFGSVLGYLVAGIIIGPSAIGLIKDPQHILHFAELGVVFLLFIIGLELQPSRLWVLRKMATIVLLFFDHQAVEHLFVYSILNRRY